MANKNYEPTLDGFRKYLEDEDREAYDWYEYYEFEDNMYRRKIGKNVNISVKPELMKKRIRDWS